MPSYYPPGTRKRTRFFVIRGQIDGREYEGGTSAGDQDDHETSKRGTLRRIRQGLPRLADTGEMERKEAILKSLRFPKTLPKAHSRRVAISEIDALAFQRCTDALQCARVWFGLPTLKIDQGLVGDARQLAKLHLGNPQKPASGPALFRRDSAVHNST